MTPETVVAIRAPFDMEELWSAPRGCSPVRLRCSTDGAPPRLATSVALWFDAEALNVLFSCADDRVEATHIRHDAPLYEEDVVEIFVAPERLERYYELEVSPRATLFDATVDSPELDRATMHVDRAWTCEGLMAAVRSITEGDGSITTDTIVRVPFASLGRSEPRDGETWRINFFRIDRHPERGDEYSAWQPTMKKPADFHVPAAFGTVRFQR
jgi:hypothetical protein